MNVPKPMEQWRAELHLKGWTVISGILTPEQCAGYRAKMQSFMESFGTGFSTADRSTWLAAKLPPTTRGLQQHQKIGHAKFAWEARSEPTVTDVFAKLWSVDSAEDLLSSFDGANFTLPKKRAGREWKHLDQGHKLAGELACYQGYLSFGTSRTLEQTPAEQPTPGLSFFTGSHYVHAQFFREMDYKTKGNWYKLEPRDYKWYAGEHCATETPRTPEGSLTLWDSRTVHDGANETDEIRMGQYVCYLPRAGTTAAQLAKKQKAFQARRMTSHWPRDSTLFSESWQHWGHPEQLRTFSARPPIRDDEMTPLMWRLAGF